ncbi:MAG: hypothetical protein JWR32_6367 [Mycobacterium sp.]|jgi:predicted metal-binding protein|nr:hypothetical protein [Mycobacterium sp.]
MWQKWILLACLGAVTCLMCALISEPAAFAWELVEEVVALSGVVECPVRRVPRDGTKAAHDEGAPFYLKPKRRS